MNYHTWSAATLSTVKIVILNSFKEAKLKIKQVQAYTTNKLTLSEFSDNDPLTTYLKWKFS